MKALTPRLWLFVAAGVCVSASGGVRADAGSDDRLVFSGSGANLSVASGGGSGSLGWLHNFSPSSLIGVAGDYDVLANAHWAFGSLSGATTLGPADARTSLYAELHEGGGEVGAHHFDYSNVAGGVYQSIGTHFSLQLEDRQIDIDTSHGNLPKIGASMLWETWLQTQAAYQKSVSGNLGTNLGSVRVDVFTKPINLLVGAAFGQGSPAVVNIQTNVVQPGSGQLREGYAGVSKTSGRHAVTLVADYLELSGVRRETLTLTYILDLRGSPK